MSKLSHLIEQAKTTRRVNDLFKAQGARFSSAPIQSLECTASENAALSVELDKLESLLFSDSTIPPQYTPAIIYELEAIAREL